MSRNTRRMLLKTGGNATTRMIRSWPSRSGKSLRRAPNESAQSHFQANNDLTHEKGKRI